MPLIMPWQVALLLATLSRGLYCGRGHPSPQQEFALSELVFTGLVVDSSTAPDSGSWMDGTIYRVQPLEVFRGNPDKVVRLFSENSTGRFPMTVGAKYLVFADSEFGRLGIDNCGNSAPLNHAQRALTIVRTLSRTHG